MRSKRCSICTRLSFDELNKVDRRLRDGEPVLRIAREHSISRGALDRHKQGAHHLEPPLRSLEEQVAVEHAEARGKLQLDSAEPLGVEETRAIAAEILRDLRGQYAQARQRPLTGNLEILRLTLTAIQRVQTLLDTPLTQAEVDQQIERGAQKILNTTWKLCPDCREVVLAELAHNEGEPEDISCDTRAAAGVAHQEMGNEAEQNQVELLAEPSTTEQPDQIPEPPAQYDPRKGPFDPNRPDPEDLWDELEEDD